MVNLTATIDDREVLDAIREAEARGVDMGPAWKVIGGILVSSITQNFESGGRPVKWKKSKRVLMHGGKTLIKDANLMDSITDEPAKDHVKVGTDEPYGAVHQFGIDEKVKVKLKGKRKMIERHMKIDARPYLVIQDHDWPEIKDAALNHIAKPFEGGRAA